MKKEELVKLLEKYEETIEYNSDRNDKLIIKYPESKFNDIHFEVLNIPKPYVSLNEMHKVLWNEADNDMSLKYEILTATRKVRQLSREEQNFYDVHREKHERFEGIRTYIVIHMRYENLFLYDVDANLCVQACFSEDVTKEIAHSIKEGTVFRCCAVREYDVKVSFCVIILKDSISIVSKNDEYKLMLKIKRCSQNPLTDFDKIMSNSNTGRKYYLTNFTKAGIKRYESKKTGQMKYQLNMPKGKFVDIDIAGIEKYDGLIFKGYALLEVTAKGDTYTMIKALKLLNKPFKIDEFEMFELKTQVSQPKNGEDDNDYEKLVEVEQKRCFTEEVYYETVESYNEKGTLRENYDYYYGQDEVLDGDDFNETEYAAEQAIGEYANEVENIIEIPDYGKISERREYLNYLGGPNVLVYVENEINNLRFFTNLNVTKLNNFDTEELILFPEYYQGYLNILAKEASRCGHGISSSLILEPKWINKIKAKYFNDYFSQNCPREYAEEVIEMSMLAVKGFVADEDDVPF